MTVNVSSVIASGQILMAVHRGGRTPRHGQSGWFTLGGTSVGAPDWAGILAAGAAGGKTALQGDAAIYSGGYSTNLRDITSGLV